MITTTTHTGHRESAGQRARPRPSRPSTVEPTVPELLAMAAGRLADWRPARPLRRELRELNREVPRLLAEFSILQLALTCTERRRRRS